MGNIKITANAKRLIITNNVDFVDVCKDIEIVMVPVRDDEFGTIVQRQIEEVGAVTYSKEQFLKEIKDDSVAVRWEYILDENNNSGLAIVLKEDK